jgi:hypothetical protein
MRRLSLLFVLSTMALGACGGGGDDAPSADEFAKDANTICADLEKAGKRLQQPESIAEIEQFAADAEKQIDAAVKRLDELETPEGEDGEKAQKFIDAIKSDTDTKIKPALQELRTAAQAKDEKAIVAAAEKIQKVEAATKNTDKLATEAGARRCAND